MDIQSLRTIDEYDQFLDAQIETNRKGELSLRLLDVRGKPLAGVPVRVKQADHDFVFGICPNGHISMTNALACGDGGEADRYWERIGGLFNATTLWWGWRVLEPRQGQWTFDREVDGYGPMERMVQRAEALGHRLTGHALLYPRRDVSPGWVPDCDPVRAVELLERHVRQTVGRYRDRIETWHPVNEAWPKPLQDVGNLAVNEGAVYQWVRELAPRSVLVNNCGYEIAPDDYRQSLERASQYGVDVDALGIRGYYELYLADDVAAYRRRWNHFDDLVRRYGKRLRYTEMGANSRIGYDGPWGPQRFITGNPKTEGVVTVDVPPGGQLPELSEQTQAEFVVRMYRTMFAHPAMDECSYWDLVDRYTWNKVEGGLVRNDLTPKPAYERLQDLIHRTWHTECGLTTDGDGRCAWRGFYGRYEVKCGGRTSTVWLTRQQDGRVLAVP